MVPRVEYGHLYKFLVSVGLLVMGFALLLPWVVLHESQELLIPADQINRLTNIASRTIQQRQEFLSLIVRVVPIATPIIFGTGFSILVIGVVNWKKRQDVFDRTEDLSQLKLEREVRDLDPVEVVEKVEAESVELESSEHADRQTHDVSQTDTRRDSTSQYEARHQDQRARLVAAESTVIAKLAAALEDTYTVRPNVAVSLGGRRQVVDALFEAISSKQPDLILEVKYLRNTFASHPLIPNALLQLSVACELYARLSDRPVNGLVVIVSAAAPNNQTGRQAVWAERIEEIRGVMRNAPSVLIIPEAELEQLDPETLKKQLPDFLGFRR